MFGKSKHMQHNDGSQGHLRRNSPRGERDHTHPIENTFDAMKIALPVVDMPIIKRNQEMRKGIASGPEKRSGYEGGEGRALS